jgi:hypothetical protein
MFWNNAFAQSDNPPGISVTLNECRRSFTLTFPAWWSNSGGNDAEMDDGFKVTINDGNNVQDVWIGNFSGSAGDGGDDIHPGWDDDEFIDWYCPGIWYVYNYSNGQASSDDGGTEDNPSANDNNVLSAVTTSGGSWVSYSLEFGPIPIEWYDGRDLTVRVSGTFNDNSVSYDKSENMSFDALDRPTGLQATTAANGGFCDEIHLNWTDASTSCNFSYEIERRVPDGNWSSIAIVEENEESYIDDNLQPEQTYEYRVRSRLNSTIGSGSIYSGFTSISTGSTLPYPSVPTNFVASTENCDQTVDLSWDYNPGNGFGELQGFTIRRNDGVEITKSANDRFHNDNVPERGTIYSYQIRSENECGVGAYSTNIEGFSPEDPSPPSQVTTQVVPGEGIRINWSDGMLVNEYKIERNLLGGGGSTILGPIDANDPNTFLDESIVPCQTYEYRVIAINACKPEGVATNEDADGKLVPDLSNTFEAGALLASKGFFSNRVELEWTVANNANLINAYKIYRRELSSPQRTLNASLNSGSNLYIDNLV